MESELRSANFLLVCGLLSIFMIEFSDESLIITYLLKYRDGMVIIAEAISAVSGLYYHN